MGNESPTSVIRGMFLGVGIAMLLWSVAYGCMVMDHEQGEPTDFTDTGVGCIDDCLEPAKDDHAK